ncbi:MULTISPECIES: PKD domain-containing protein [unclassified Imperialibacter]|uniref:PKD domain-containing protein n=1 Tax=unclassified Imperialibacter TaxID=2629706 RepID=UPI00125FA6E3|nr:MULTISPECIES: PKD domain-containing protein [unclassified Imperialibacter]
MSRSFMKYLLFFLFLAPLSCLAQSVDFSVDFSEGCAPLTVKFTDKSTASPITDYQWTFGNGNSSVLQNPGAVYTGSGTFQVTLVVKSGATTLGTKTMDIVVHDKPSIDFSFSPAEGCSPLPVSFVAESLTAGKTLQSFEWVFGDGSSSNEEAPTNTYKSQGDYSVTLVAKDQFGCESTVSKSAIIKAYGIKATIGADKTVLCETPAQVNFNATATGSGVTGTGQNISYKWDFGDGTSSTAQNPPHTYSTVGDYKVTMTATDEKGCQDSQQLSVVIGSGTGISFTASASQACVDNQVYFIEASDKTILSRHWDFGNGKTSEEASPVTTFSQPGKYQVVLTAQLQGQACEAKTVKEIIVGADAAPSFTAQQKCSLQIQFSNSSTNSNRWSWNFGDGMTSEDESPIHAYAAPGLYQVTLTSYSIMDCEALYTQEVEVVHIVDTKILPEDQQSCSEISLSGCAPFTLPFTSVTEASESYSLLWTFGDNTSTTEANPIHVFAQPGTYEVVLLATSASGCTSRKEVDVVVSSTVPTAAFTVSKQVVCAWEPINFRSESLNATFYCWDFGDSTGTIEENPIHSYERPGLYTVKLKAKNAGCEDEIIKTELIEVLNPFVGFDFSKSCDDPNTINISNFSSDYDGITWEFGDGTKSNEITPSHTYPGRGTYTLKATAFNDETSCVVSVEQGVSIYNVRADFSTVDTTTCKGIPVQFNDASTDAEHWAWTFPDGSKSDVTNPMQIYFDAGYFGAELTVTDPDECTSTIKKEDVIRVLDIDGAFSFITNNKCDSLVVNFKDFSRGSPGIVAWEWDFGDGGSSTSQNPVHAYYDEMNYNIGLTLTNTEGTCSIFRENVISFVKPVPRFMTEADAYCVNDTLVLENISMNAVSYSWELGDGSTSTELVPVVSYNTPGSYTIKLLAQDADGCLSKEPAIKEVIVAQPQAKFEAVNTFTECPPLITTFQDKSGEGIASYQWDFGDGQTSALAQPVVTYLIPGDYSVSLSVEDAYGCISTVTKDTIVSVGGPYGSLDFDSLSTCEGFDILFEAHGTNTSTYRWDFGDGDVVDTQSSSINRAYNEAGSYFLNVVFINSQGCTVPYQVSPAITVAPGPESDFIISEMYPFTHEEVVVSVTEGSDSLAYFWLVDGIEWEGNDVAVAFENYGDNDVTLFTKDTVGCGSAVVHSFFVQEEVTDLPNAFSPNNDSFNNSLYLPGVENGLWTLEIYSRSGNQVFRRERYANDWEGGELAAGVYFYQLANELRPEKKLKGYLHLVR